MIWEIHLRIFQKKTKIIDGLKPEVDDISCDISSLATNIDFWAYQGALSEVYRWCFTPMYKKQAYSLFFPAGTDILPRVFFN